MISLCVFKNEVLSPFWWIAPVTRLPIPWEEFLTSAAEGNLSMISVMTTETPKPVYLEAVLPSSALSFVGRIASAMQDDVVDSAVHYQNMLPRKPHGPFPLWDRLFGSAVVRRRVYLKIILKPSETWRSLWSRAVSGVIQKLSGL